MGIPLLQLALDNLTLQEALASVRVLAPQVDVIEVGTLLCLSEGANAIQVIRVLYPEHTLVADLKIVDAGGELASMACGRGADWVTVMCNASNATKAKAIEAMKGRGGEVQVELFGNWTLEEAREWRTLGLKQLIYHQSRDALSSGKGWGKENIEKVRSLTELGFEVSVTGGIHWEVLGLFKGLPLKSFIVGRSLREASDPAKEAQLYRDTIQTYWGG